MTNEKFKLKQDQDTIHKNIPGKLINGGTIPADILTVGQRQDIVLINRSEKKIALLELTVSFKKILQLQTFENPQDILTLPRT